MRSKTVLAAMLLTLGILTLAVVIFRKVLDAPLGGTASSPDGLAFAPADRAAPAGGPDGGAAPAGARGAAGAEAGSRSPDPLESRGATTPGSTSADPGGPGRSEGRSQDPSPGTTGGGPGGSSPAERPLGKGNSAIAVIVTDPDGQPFAGVSVAISGGPGGRSMATDRAGVAEMAEIPAGSYEVRVHPPGPGAPSLRSVRPAELAAGERLEVRCQVPAFDAQIQGRVLDPAGEPVKGIAVEARPLAFPGAAMKFESVDAPLASAASGPDGVFQIDGLARVEHSISTRETPRYPSARTVAVAGSDEPVDITVGERRVLAIEGLVMDADGAAVAGVQVSVRTHPAAPGTTDPAGRFRIEVQYERGAVAFLARKAGYADGESVITTNEIGDQDEMEVALVIEPLGKTGELRGRISDPKGAPLPRQVVRIHSSSLNGNYQGVSGEDGEYSIRDIRIAPDYQALVNPERGWADFLQGPFEVAEGSTRLDIMLTPLETGRLTGRMLDPDGRPISRLTLWVRSIAASSNISTATSDEQGRFTIEEAPAGDLRFETRASPLISVQGIKLEAGESKEVDLLVGLGQGRLEGTVSAVDGKTAIAGARLTLSWTGARGAIQSTVYREVSSDAQGQFSFSGLSSGRGSLIVSAPGYLDHRQSRDLTGERDEIQITLNTAQP